MKHLFVISRSRQNTKLRPLHLLFAVGEKNIRHLLLICRRLSFFFRHLFLFAVAEKKLNALFGIRRFFVEARFGIRRRLNINNL